MKTKQYKHSRIFRDIDNFLGFGIFYFKNLSSLWGDEYVITPKFGEEA